MGFEGRNTGEKILSKLFQFDDFFCFFSPARENFDLFDLLEGKTKGQKGESVIGNLKLHFFPFLLSIKTTILFKFYPQKRRCILRGYYCLQNVNHFRVRVAFGDFHHFYLSLFVFLGSHFKRFPRRIGVERRLLPLEFFLLEDLFLFGSER